MVLCFTSVTCNVYNVTPNDIRCDHCFNLLDLPSLTKNFTSHTYFHFLHGLHHLPTDLIIQNVNNISLIGSEISTTTPSTVIQCASSVGIIMTNITNLIVKNMVIQNCKNEYDSLQAAVFIKECHFITLQSVHIYHTTHVISLLGVNILGNSYLHEVKCHEIHFYYNETTVKAIMHNVLINSFYAMNHFTSDYGIYLNMSQHTYKITLQVVNTTIQQVRQSVFLCALSNNTVNQNTVLITKCQFHNNNNYKTIKHLFYLDKVNVNFIDSQIYNINFRKTYQPLAKITCSDNVTFFNLSLEHNRLHKRHPIIQSTHSRLYKEVSLIQIINVSNVTVEDCYFHDNKQVTILDALNVIAIEIKNTIFSVIQTASECTLLLHNCNLLLNGPVVFHKSKNNLASVVKLLDSNITVHGYIEFSENYAFSIIMFDCNRMTYCSIIKVLDNTTIVITSNGIFTYFVDSINPFSDKTPVAYPQCLFQYFSTRNLDSFHTAGNFSIIVEYNRYENLSTMNNLFNFLNLVWEDHVEFLSKLQPYISFSKITHCSWLPQSAFYSTIPLKVNKQYITYTNNSKFLHLSKEKTLCYCGDEKHYDCFKDVLDSVYPGQTLTLSLYANVQYIFDTEVITELEIKQPYITQCNMINAKQNIQFIGKNCTMVKYAVGFPTNSSWCELLLKMPQTHNQYDAYYIRELPCPLGFVKIDGICQCYPSFEQFGFTDCDINTQTILRPSKGWILFNNAQENSSYSCYISQSCLYDYCKPYAFYLNLSIPDSQCQFNRTGRLCGQCQQGLSTIFSSHDCQHCSNIYLLLLIPIGIAGLILILLLFLLNLTVTDGTINPFIFYINIISINYTIFFPNNHTNTVPLYTLISLANLNLGIKTCFYNGMDDYAKVWLQLAFPFYIITLGILIIIVSRYSVTIQRLTVQKSSAVLATLFLLSFTNILCTTSSVLFSYSSISHLPNEQTILVWSLDANIPLFGAKFSLLFILCLILFLLLILFTVTMLCAKALTKFKFFNTILDIYQRPYRLHYWFGLQVVMRVIFFYISQWDEKINVFISLIILNIASAIQGIQKPFQNKLDDHSEMLLMIKLFALYVFALSEWWVINEVLIVITGIQFSCVILYRFMNWLCGGIIRKYLLDSTVVARLL